MHRPPTRKTWEAYAAPQLGLVTSLLRYIGAMPSLEDFAALGIRTGIVTRAEPNEGARSPALKLWIDFGALGELQSSAKITDLYTSEELVGRCVVAVTGFEAMRVNGFRSDVLVLGVETPDGVRLLNVDGSVEPGSSIS